MAVHLCGGVSLARLILFCILFRLDQLAYGVASNDDSYDKYQLSHPGNELKPHFEYFRDDGRTISKRSVLLPQLQPPGNVTNLLLEPVTVPDQAVIHDGNTGGNKTGGNYLTEANATLPVVEKKTETMSNSSLDLDSKQVQAKAITTSPVVPDAKTDVSKTDKTKKVESETKPPKPAPTKAPINEEKLKKLTEKTAVVEVTPDPKVVASSTTPTPDQDLRIPDFPQDVTNTTLLQNHINATEEDHHQYYNSSFIVNNEAVGLLYWINMTERPDVHVNELLSQSHRRAATVKLSFDFPFYGHLVRNVTIATGGFLYTGEYVHSWLAATQYIAPLMANFDTSISNKSFVKYVDNGTAFTVQWEKVLLQDKPSSGDFTFQATLHSNGDIVFVYQNVPVVIENIQDDHHPVKVGLSDAYIIDRTIFFVRRKTIYEYHRVNFDRQDIKNWTVIYLNALPTCLDVKDCSECLSRSTGFQCNWCSHSNRCSNGMDRFRQEWLLKGCEQSSISNVTKCPAKTSSHTAIMPSDLNSSVSDPTRAFSDKHSLSEHEDQSDAMGVSGIIGILFLIGLFAGIGIWIMYSYRNPHTPSGQFLIRYRPSTWSWRRGEARYTAATIHM